MDARDPFAAIGGRFFYFDGLLKEIKVCPLVLEGWIDLRQLRTTKERLSCRLLSERVRDSDIRLLMRNWMERIKNFDIQFVKQIYPRNENAWFVKVNRAWSYFYLINAGSAPKQRRRRLHEEAGLLHGRSREKLALTFHHCLFKSVHLPAHFNHRKIKVIVIFRQETSVHFPELLSRGFSAFLGLHIEAFLHLAGKY